MEFLENVVGTVNDFLWTWILPIILVGLVYCSARARRWSKSG